MFAVLLVLIMIFQTIPVMAADTSEVEVSDAATLFTLNQNLDANVKITKSFTIKIDQDFVNQYGAWYIGSATNPFTGNINGNNNTITLRVDTSVADWALFHTLESSAVKNLNIVLEEFYSSSNDNNVSVSVLAQTIRNSTITSSKMTLKNRAGTKMFAQKDNRNIDVATVAITHEGSGTVALSGGYLDLLSVPDNAKVTAGSVVRTKPIANSTNQLNVQNNIAYKTYVYAHDSSYVVGSSIGEVIDNTRAVVSNGGQLYYRNNSAFNVSAKKNNPTVVLGGAIGTVYAKASASVSGDIDAVVQTWGVTEQLSAGAACGINYGILEVSHATSMLQSTDGDNVVSYLPGFTGDTSKITIGGVVGEANGQTLIHSNGVNMKLYGTNIQNSEFILGLFVGSSSGLSTRVEDNGSSLFSKQISTDANDSMGIIIGKDYNTGYLGIQYNIINATDEKSLKGDYDWISIPVGNIPKNQRIDLFKNNYWAYMGYARLNVPTQIYFTVPMNYYGDNPPLETSADYPFIGKYSYLYPTQETNQYLTFQNPTERGIGTVLLTKDCLASVKVSFSILPEYAEGYWGGHYYKNDDVLNYLGMGEDDPQFPDGGGQGPDIPSDPPGDDDPDKTIIDTYYYTRVEQGIVFDCVRNLYDDGTSAEVCIRVDDGNKPDKQIVNQFEYTYEDDGKTWRCKRTDWSDGTWESDCEVIEKEKERVYDSNHGNPDYDCTWHETETQIVERCVLKAPEYVYDRNHGKEGYYCYFDKIGNKYYETCEKEEEYVYDRNHGKPGYTCTFEKQGEIYYETCIKKEPEYVYDKNHGHPDYTCEFEYRNNKYYEKCVKNDEITPEGWDEGFVKSGFSQAVVNKGPYAGSPLPTYTENKKSDVKFNYYDLSYEIKYTDNNFDDIKGHRYEEEMIEAANRLIIKGYGDGNFGPDKDITRAEFATMVVRTLGLIPSDNVSFDDVKEGAWYYEFVNTAADWGIVVGIGNNLFAPEKNITRQEAAIMLMRAAKILEENDFEAKRKQLFEVEFYGWEESAMWARTEVIESVLYGIVDLRDGGQFEPLSNITRAETASGLLNLLKKYNVINR